MGERRVHLAVDLGASSGRVIGGELSDDRLSISVIHRFPNRAVWTHDDLAGGRLLWDILGLWDHILDGLSRAAAMYSDDIVSIGVDSWAVDYGLLTESGRLVGHPVCYRDERTQAVFLKVRSVLTDQAIYERTGVQLLPLNTLYQLAADAIDPDRPLDRAATVLLIPDLIAFWLTGERVCERSNASHTQLFDARSDAWIDEFAEGVGVPSSILPRVVPAGTVLGSLLPAVLERTGLPSASRVIAPATHDTGSAVAGTPIVDRTRAAFISSGTWMPTGVELLRPMGSDEARRCNFTNEAGVAGTTRFLKSVTGLWILQECRRAWEQRGGSYSFAELTAMAEQADPASVCIDVDDPVFASPGDMPARILRYCSERGWSVPQDEGAVVRCVLESLAIKASATIRSACSLHGMELDRVHIVGGGSRNALLNQLIADSTGVPVEAEPSEATACGNIMVQAAAFEKPGGLTLGDLDWMRSVIRNSFDLTVFEPERDQAQLDRWARFAEQLTPTDESNTITREVR